MFIVGVNVMNKKEEGFAKKIINSITQFILGSLAAQIAPAALNSLENTINPVQSSISNDVVSGNTNSSDFLTSADSTFKGIAKPLITRERIPGYTIDGVQKMEPTTIKGIEYKEQFIQRFAQAKSLNQNFEMKFNR
jgi:hypothetical protein